MRGAASRRTPPASARFFGSDRDAGAVAMAEANAERAGVAELTEFHQRPVSDLAAPAGPPGLVIANPPYGGRIGDRTKLLPLYRALGQALLARFPGWRVGLVTSDPALARATGLPFLPPAAPVPHGGLRVRLFHTAALP
jgi:putative N6-adenine-specific DNA methylase